MAKYTSCLHICFTLQMIIHFVLFIRCEIWPTRLNKVNTCPNSFVSRLLAAFPWDCQRQERRVCFVLPFN